MEYVIGIILIAGFAGFIWLQGAARKGLNRALHRNQHQLGQRLLNETLSLTVPPMPVAEVIDAIIAELNVYDEAIIAKQRAYVTRVDAGTASVAHGNKMFTNWQVAILANAGEAGKVTVLLTMVEAMEVDGVVQATRELSLVHDRVKSAVAKLQRQLDGV